ncbi:primosomal protein N' [Atopobacter sp. AH10]|uniref:primosomal protein N' n=1 Tax=Atopobacter sp. AH10 TaxID=2315861 RepID=UPI000EF18277|nr:primosomal protein N' [Atopobacter sp. AH10]RLK64040.1 primosomal protein N' [Atopobacter sp. AH10]
MTFAQVIVDVPHQKVNRPFDYLIPDKLKEELELGSRVEVPFGVRKIQGFVIGMTEETTFEGSLKEVQAVMDDFPVLSKELIQLGQWMANYYYSFLISIYQMMLPNLLKSSYQRFFVWTDQASPALKNEMNFDLPLTYEKAEEKGLLDCLYALKKEAMVEIDYKVKDHGKVKKLTRIYANIKEEEICQLLASLPKSYAGQEALLKALLEDPCPMRIELLKKSPLIKSSTIKAAEKKGWVRLEEEAISSQLWEKTPDQLEHPFPLTEAQEQAFQPVITAIQERKGEVFLLEGITGSGKTELYLQWIQECLDRGQSALMLVPEIALTPQMTARFTRRFGETVAVWHSGLSEREQFDEWRRLKSFKAKVVVGARSAIFAPLENIGLIILDEEHESSYQQMEKCRYHARDIAKWRAAFHHCPVVLGSATPSLESRARAHKGVYQFLSLLERPTANQLPEVRLIDMRKELLAGKGHLSESLIDAIKNRLDKKEQVVLLLNRRGYSAYVQCRHCGYVHMCPNCNISLTLHLKERRMKCHYCDHHEDILECCPKCQGAKLRYIGVGTQKIEEELQDVFKEARIIRMDVDTTKGKGKHEALLSQMAKGQADILLGTQMIAKGLDFPNVTLVGVLNADTGLNIPDFRAYERTFQLLTQVSGRAGRGEKKGLVLIQTYNPDHYVLQDAKRQDYETFFKKEMTMRKLGQYPPYYYMVRISIAAKEENLALKEGYRLKRLLEKEDLGQVIILGPSVQSIGRINRFYYYQLLIKYKDSRRLDQRLNQLALELDQVNRSDLLFSIQRDPQNFI